MQLLPLREATYPILARGVGSLPRFEAWKGNTEKGFDLDLRSNLWHEESRDSVADRMAREVGLELPEPLLSFEHSERENIGAYSIQDPFERRRESLNEFYGKVIGLPSVMDRVSDDLARLFPTGSLNTISLDQAVERLPKRKGLGLPVLGSNPDHLPLYVDRARNVLSGGTESIHDAMLYWRGTPGGNLLVKQRNVLGMDKLDAILGGRFVHPITDHLRKRREFAAYVNSEAVADGVSWMLARSNRDKISMDYSRFDTTLSFELMERVLFAMERAFNDNRGFDVVRNGLYNTGITTPEGVFRQRTRGLPSGTIMTSVLGSVVNWAVSLGVAYLLGVSLISGMYLGDDSVLDYQPEVPDDEFTEAVAQFGLVTHEDKRFRSENAVHYLQNVHTRDYQEGGVSVGVRPMMRMLNGALSYERSRRDWNRWLAASRTIMQLENCKYHPLFPGIVKFVSSGDDYLLEYTPAEIFVRAGGASKIVEVLGLDQFSLTSRDPYLVGSFRTTEVLRSLS